VLCSWPEGSSGATVTDHDMVNDVALMRLDRVLPDALEPVSLSRDVVVHDQWSAPGAPAELGELFLSAVSGLVVMPDGFLPDGARGMELLCWESIAGLPLAGLSGAPVLTGTPPKAVGLIRWNPQQQDHPERAAGATVYAAPAARMLERWPELAPAVDLPELIRHLADRSRPRNAGAVYAQVRTLFLAGSLGLGEEDLWVVPAPGDVRSQMIAVDAGQAIISVVRDLSSASAAAVAEQELAGAVASRAAHAGQRYAAVLTDGAEWRLYCLDGSRLRMVDAETADPRAPGKLLGWLEAALATGSDIVPTRVAIENKLGASSPSCKLNAAELAVIYARHRDEPTVSIKRLMWAKLLTTASGISFDDDDSLFINHTLLVATAKVIGHAALGILSDSKEATAAALMSGALFAKENITGVIESDFFDWITEVPEGEQFVQNLARQLARFNWHQVQHDVLKHLYESVIPKVTRHQLGEYYTPDWLAEAVIAETVHEPLCQRVLDASCGSGTFLFHAVRSYFAAAETAGRSTAEAIDGVVEHVMGIDVHPVAVTLARVTYLLAIGGQRLQRHPAFSVPVFLGDSLRWGEEVNLLTYDYEGLSVSTRLDPESFVTAAAAPSQSEFATQLNFPDRVVADTGRFDALVTRLAMLATSRLPEDPVPPLSGVFQYFSVSADDQPVLQQTFETMCQLHDQGKDHIWGYYVRNLARPAWLARPANQVDVLVGNPPWLVYRFMTKRQQMSFREMSSERGLWAGGTASPGQELAALFVARCIELYLRPGGRFGYVMPWAVLPRPGQGSRAAHAGFRAGLYPSPAGSVAVAFTQAWDLHRIKRFFPQPASAIFGRRQEPGSNAKPLTGKYQAWAGRFDSERATWAEAAPCISIIDTEPAPEIGQYSRYAGRFTQGATVLPRCLFLVDNEKAGPLGSVAGRRAVRSHRSPNEKNPWNTLDDLRGAVEEEFIFPVYLGESVLPFRCQAPLQAVIPWDGQYLGGTDERLSQHPGLASWWNQAEAAWAQHNRSHRMSLGQRLDFRRGLSRQFPAPERRVVYSKSGVYLAAAVVTDPLAVIDHKLYWGPVAGDDEARYLTGILNSDVLTAAVRPMQARGEHNPRDFDKYIFQFPIPLYDPSNPSHAQLTALATRAERIAANVPLPRARFELQRKCIRQAIESDGISAEINSVVKGLLDITK
jgi:SAM-dependent methyltransferase